MSEPMAMLPNGSYPGPRCSCADCLRSIPGVHIVEQSDGHALITLDTARVYIDGPIATDIVNAARLIAVAPELLEVCKRIRRKINDYVSIRDVDALDAAIAKAEDRS